MSLNVLKKDNCNKVLKNNLLYSIHIFLRHYEECKTRPVEEKSIIQERIGNIKIHKISFDQHSNDFFDCDSVIENFLTYVQSRFVPITNEMTKVECSFSVINIQLSLHRYRILVV